MQKTILFASAALLALSMITPVAAAPTPKNGISAAAGFTEMDRKGRKKPRIPGGSGCDNPRDLIQHPECAG